MSLSTFHPIIERWWFQRFAEPVTGRLSAPTEAQRRGWEAIRGGGHTLIAAPTGSGKTLAAFLTAIDDLLREGLEQPLPDETRVVYVSPLKALSADIHCNLAEPRREIRQIAESMGLPPVRITAAVRTGDTPQSERAAMLRSPPHILVTTPESLYLLLTAERSRKMLRSTRAVIVDEIHAVIESRRGAHLALSLERLDHVCGHRIQRVGLSATQKPIEEVASFLVGSSPVEPNSLLATSSGSPAIIDAGHLRELDLGIEVPDSPLEAVMAAEAWQEVHERLVALIEQHRTTLVFVNTRRLAERLARALSERLGEDAVTSHHGSLARDVRLDAEERLKTGRLKALVATASLELGIDIGYVDLVCQIGSPRRIATLLQRVGRSGHTVRGTPKGRLFPLTRDDLVECTALLHAVQRRELDRVIIPEKPLDVLAQQIVAEAAAQDWQEDALFERLRGAWPYRTLERTEFDEVVSMLTHGFTTRRGRRAALLHHDAVNRRIRGRRHARLAAITSGGAIPEVADFRVVLEPEGSFVGTLNEDFAIESIPGDVFQLGNTSWRILRIESGVVRVADAEGQPPNIPFWLGEAPSRSDELSAAVSGLREDVERLLGETAGGKRDSAEGASEAVEGPGEPAAADTNNPNQNAYPTAEDVGETVGGANRPTGGAPDPSDRGREPAQGANERAATASDPALETAVHRLAEAYRLETSAASQIVAYLAETKRLLGVIPTQRTIVLERFFDDAGGMQLLLHAPFGARVNRAWGLALRKKFCRTFNFELQAAATDNGLLLSLGPQHSFPLEEVFEYLRPETLKATLVQAVLDSPLFQTRWRWTTTLSLAVLRSRNGTKVPPQIQRMQAEDLLAAAFPDAAACLENVAGDRDVPDHPLVTQAVRDCLEEAMDLPALDAIVRDVLGCRIERVARDTPEPSPIGHEILTARPYAFLDDAPLEERRAHAVYTRRALEPSSARDLGALDPDAIERVREEAWPDAENADELHDALLTSGFLFEREASTAWPTLFRQLCDAGRATRLWPQAVDASGRATATPYGDPGAAAQGPNTTGNPEPCPYAIWVVAERLREAMAVFPATAPEPALTPPAPHNAAWERHDALREVLRGRLEILGPITASAMAAQLGAEESDVDIALVALEAEGVILRGHFTPGQEKLEWCDRRLLARMHRYTLDRLRAEIQPVNGADFMRFLFRWQRVEPGTQTRGADGLTAVLEQLDGFELAAAAWEADVLPSRVDGYSAELLDQLCLTGRLAWGRLSPPRVNGTTPRLVRSSLMALFLRRNAALWLGSQPRDRPALSGGAAQVLEVLERRGASFFDELVAECRMLPTHVEQALGELAALGVVTSDGFSGLRALLTPSELRRPMYAQRRRRRTSIYGVDTAGRWTMLTPLRSASVSGVESVPAAAQGSARVVKNDGSGGRGLEHDWSTPRAQPGASLEHTGPRRTPTSGLAVPAAVGGQADPQPKGRRSSSRTPARPSTRTREAAESYARTLLRRYGVIFRRLLARETNAPPWRELVMIYRRLEARGEIRGGRFVAGMTGEQFALPEAVPLLRGVRKEERAGRLIAIGAADPLNLVGIVTPEERVPALAANRILYRDGLPIAAIERRVIRKLSEWGQLDERAVRAALVRRPADPALRAYLKGAGARAQQRHPLR